MLLTGEGFEPPVEQPVWGAAAASPSDRPVRRGRHPLLPGPAHRREHRVRRGPGRRGRRGRRRRRTDLRHVAAGRPGRPARVPRHPRRPGHHGARRRRHPPGHGLRRRGRRRLGRPRARRPGHPDPAGPLPDLGPRLVGGLRRGDDPARRGHPGRGAGVRRADHHRAVLVQGDRRRRAAGATCPTPSGAAGSPRSRSTTPGSATSRRPSARSRSCCRRTRPSTPGSATPSAWTPRSPLIRLLRALRDGRLRPRRAGRDPRHRRARPGRGRGARHHRRQRPDPRPHRRRRPGPRVADLRSSSAASRCGSPPPPTGAGWPSCPHELSRGGDRGLGRGAGRAVRRPDARPRGRDRRRHPAGRQRGDPGPAAARVRREPDRDLPRPRPGAVAPLPRGVPLDRARVRRTRDGPRRQARQPGVAAGQEPRACPRPAAPTRRSARCR